MIIYLVQMNNPPMRHLDYYDGFVIVAKSARDARKIASRHIQEGMEPATKAVNPVFLDKSRSSCLKIGNGPKSAPVGVVMASFNAG